MKTNRNLLICLLIFHGLQLSSCEYELPVNKKESSIIDLSQLGYVNYKIVNQERRYFGDLDEYVDFIKIQKNDSSNQGSYEKIILRKNNTISSITGFQKDLNAASRTANGKIGKSLSNKLQKVDPNAFVTVQIWYPLKGSLPSKANFIQGTTKAAVNSSLDFYRDEFRKAIDNNRPTALIATIAAGSNEHRSLEYMPVVIAKQDHIKARTFSWQQQRVGY